MSLVDMFKPETLDEYYGNKKAVKKIVDYVENYTPDQSKILLLVGKPGMGKTSLVYAVAGTYGMKVIEINSSDSRNKADFEEIIQTAVLNDLDSGAKKIILIDEVDGLRAADSLLKLARISAFPVVATGNFIHKVNSKIKKNAIVVHFYALSDKDKDMYIDYISDRLKLDMPQAARDRIKSICNSYRAILMAIESGINSSFKYIRHGLTDKYTDMEQVALIMEKKLDIDSLTLDGYVALKWFDANNTDPEDLIAINLITALSRKQWGVHKINKWLICHADVSMRGDRIRYPMWRKKKSDTAKDKKEDKHKAKIKKAKNAKKSEKKKEDKKVVVTMDDFL